MKKIGIMLALVIFLVSGMSNTFAGESNQKGHQAPPDNAGDCIPDGPPR
jgi:hypothetical protein